MIDFKEILENELIRKLEGSRKGDYLENWSIGLGRQISQTALCCLSFRGYWAISLKTYLLAVKFLEWSYGGSRGVERDEIVPLLKCSFGYAQDKPRTTLVLSKSRDCRSCETNTDESNL